MAMTYTWKILQLKKTSVPSANLTDVIVATRWQITGTDEDGNEASYEGATPFRASEVDPNNFVNFSNLTEEMVIGWIQQVVIGDALLHAYNQIEKQIQKIKVPIEDVDYFPWDPATPITEKAQLEVLRANKASTEP
jgi:hypothetical protein